MSKNKVGDLAEDLATDLKKVIEDLEDNEDVVKLKAQAKEVADVATEFIREYPLQTFVGAAAVGIALGYLIGRRK